jgi:hypothetical protein
MATPYYPDLWQPLTTISLSQEWQFTPLTEAVYFRLRHTSNFGYIKGYFGQAYVGEDGKTDLFDISTIFPSTSGEIIKLFPLVVANQFCSRQLCCRLTKQPFNPSSNWTIQVDYMPISQTDLFSAVNGSSGTANQTSITSVITPVLILAANTNRRSFTIYNSSTKILYLKLGAYVTGATQSQAIADSGIVIPASGIYEPPLNYTGVINGIWSAANGNAIVQEFV